MTKVETKVDEVRIELIVKKLEEEMTPRIRDGISENQLREELQNTIVYGIMKASYDNPNHYLSQALQNMKTKGKIIENGGLFFLNGEYHG